MYTTSSGLALATLPGELNAQLAGLAFGPVALLVVFALQCERPMVPSVLAYRRDFHPKNRFCRLVFAASLLTVSLQWTITSAWRGPCSYYALRGDGAAGPLANVLAVGYMVSCLPLPVIAMTSDGGPTLMAAAHFGAEGVLLIARIVSYVAEITIISSYPSPEPPAAIVDRIIVWTDVVVLLSVATFVLLFVPLFVSPQKWAGHRVYTVWVALEWIWVFGFAVHPVFHSWQLSDAGLAGPLASDCTALATTAVALPMSVWILWTVTKETSGEIFSDRGADRATGPCIAIAE